MGESISEKFNQTRYIKQLPFFGVEKDRCVRHKTLEAVRNNIKYNVFDMPHIRQLFEIHNESDVVEYNVNVFKSYYELYSYNQYISNMYKSNKVKHFKSIIVSHNYFVIINVI